jgi:hypothetical protein
MKIKFQQGGYDFDIETESDYCYVNEAELLVSFGRLAQDLTGLYRNVHVTITKSPDIPEVNFDDADDIPF